MRKKIIAGILAAVLAVVPAGSVHAQSMEAVLMEEESGSLSEGEKTPGFGVIVDISETRTVDGGSAGQVEAGAGERSDRGTASVAETVPGAGNASDADGASSSEAVPDASVNSEPKEAADAGYGLETASGTGTASVAETVLSAGSGAAEAADAGVERIPDAGGASKSEAARDAGTTSGGENVADTGITSSRENASDAETSSSGEAVHDTGITSDGENAPSTGNASGSEAGPDTGSVSDSDTEPATDAEQEQQSETAEQEALLPAEDSENQALTEAQSEIETDGETQEGLEAEKLNLEENGLLLSVEETEAPKKLSQTVTLKKTVSGRLDEAGHSTDGSLPMMRTLAHTTYVESYGGQLDGLAQQLYTAMKNLYVTKRETGDLSYEFTDPYVFRVEGGYLDTDEDGDTVLVWDPDVNGAYQEIENEICYSMQAAYDAFIYDYPEVFWLAAPEYSWGLSFTGRDDTYFTGRISGIHLMPNEHYKGAASEVDAFDRAVNQTVSEISSGLSANASHLEIVKAIHDYLCKTLSFAENDYAHTAAGVFLKNKKVVCEGYAKSFKILCDKFGYQSAIVSGEALKSDGSTEAHMWNYARMGDGKWYLLDATWDDQESYISRKYFLAGSSSLGFYAPISEERLVYTSFSGVDVLTKSFEMPELNQNAYNGSTVHTHEWASEKKVDREPTCTQEGSKSLHCRICRLSKPGSLETIARTAHKETDVKVIRAATCQKEGEASYTCSVCGYKGTKVLPRTAHKWNTKKTTDSQATCIKKGRRSIHCSVCNAVKSGTVETIGLTTHKYGKWKVTKSATALASGQRQHTCTVCREVQTAKIAKLKPTLQLNVSSVTLKKGQSTSKVKVSGLAKGDYIKSWTSSNKKRVTVNKKGTIRALKTTGKHPVKITVTLASGLKKSISVKVQKSKVKTTKVSCTPGSVTVKKGAKVKLKPSVSPITSQEKVTYRTSNKRVAVVNSKGVVTAKGAGTAKITITSGKKKCTVKVTVPAVKTKNITAAAAITLKKGKTRKLSVKLAPANSDEKITYSSSNAKIVSVNKSGKITAKKKGTAVITIRSGNVRFTCRVKVK